MNQEAFDSGRDPRGRFAKGNAGGPGRPPSHAVVLREAVLSTLGPEHVAGVMRRVTRAALEGDLRAARIVFERVLGRPREEAEDAAPLAIELPPLETAADCAKASIVVLNALITGDVGLDAGRVLLEAVHTRARALEAVDFELRLQQLEESQALRSRS